MKDFEVKGNVIIKYRGVAKQLGQQDFPKHVDIIDQFAFAKNQHIESIVLPDEIVQIGWAAFQNCENLSQIILSKNINLIGIEAFQSCKKLKLPNFPSSLTKIDNWAFDDCKNIGPDLVIPDNVKELGAWSFYGCTGLRTVSLRDNIKLYTDPFNSDKKPTIQKIILRGDNGNIEHAIRTYDDVIKVYDILFKKRLELDKIYE